MRDYKKNLQEDVQLRAMLKGRLRQAGVEHIEFERSANKLSVIIFTSRPGLIIGRGGSGIDDLRNAIEKFIGKNRAASGRPQEVRLEVQEIRTPELHASLVAASIAEQLERRMSFRRVIKRTLDRVMANKEILGARIMVKGRLDGTEMARREWVKAGRLPTQTLRADIDYAQATAHTTYGTNGVQVWIYKGEKLD